MSGMKKDDFMFLHEGLNPLGAGITRNGLCPTQADFYRQQWVTLQESHVWQRFNSREICFLLKYTKIEDVAKYVDAALRAIDPAKISIILDGWIYPEGHYPDFGALHRSFWFTTKPLSLSDPRITSLLINSRFSSSNSKIHCQARDIYEQEMSLDFRLYQQWEYFDCRSLKIVIDLD